MPWLESGFKYLFVVSASQPLYFMFMFGLFVEMLVKCGKLYILLNYNIVICRVASSRMNKLIWSRFEWCWIARMSASTWSCHQMASRCIMCFNFHYLTYFFSWLHRSVWRSCLQTFSQDFYFRHINLHSHVSHQKHQSMCNLKTLTIKLWPEILLWQILWQRDDYKHLATWEFWYG